MSQLLFSVFADAATAEALPTPDLARAVEEAVRHKCAPLFAQRLEDLGLAERLAPHARQTLADERRACAIRNLGGRRQLLELAARAGVPLVALKGACLARTAYPDLSLRPMVDLDVLARGEHLAAVRAALAATGYIQAHPTPMSFHGKHEEAPFTRPQSLPIELHHSLLDEGHPFAIDMEDLWRRARPADDLPGLWYLEAEDQFLHVCVHAGYHHELGIGLYAFLDLAAMARRSALDWDRLLARAGQWRAGRCAYLCLRVTERTAGPVFPAAFMRALRPPGFREAWVDAALEVIRHKPARGYVPARMLADLLAHVRRSGWGALGPTLRRRFLGPPAQRSTWPGSPQGRGWIAQLRPILVGAAHVVRSRRERDVLRARLAGVRLRRWMASTER